MDPKELKQQLLDMCLAAQNQRIANAQKAMNEAQEAANSEEKSTAGDKYDTSRAMSQNARDMNAKQLDQALNELSTLQQININLTFDKVRPGAVIKTTNGNYFISASLGQLKINNEVYFAVSLTAPIAQAMFGVKKGDSFQFRNTPIKVLELF